ncbi:hypothetical protein [Azospirillum thermophilum]|uniref:Transcriptional regulator n=1 Tax=Azospirillum thermophilum TaxID=2202148 RepID=A0A2S2CZN8_9PROT|nr:hypothetical protein [Azospirillum thermophilum]AWK89974.1 hypothetical protein DEW08_28635 [Azospirillum thermophilum]
MVLSDDALTLLRRSVRSVWALELLLLLRRECGRSWTPDTLVAELRGSPMVVGEALGALTAAGLVAKEPDGALRYHPVAEVLDRWVQEIAEAYSLRPSAVIREIFASPQSKVQIFADSFRFRSLD